MLSPTVFGGLDPGLRAEGWALSMWGVVGFGAGGFTRITRACSSRWLERPQFSSRGLLEYSDVVLALHEFERAHWALWHSLWRHTLSVFSASLVVSLWFRAEKERPEDGLDTQRKKGGDFWDQRSSWTHVDVTQCRGLRNSAVGDHRCTGNYAQCTEARAGRRGGRPFLQLSAEETWVSICCQDH